MGDDDTIDQRVPDYPYGDASHTHAHAYLLPVVDRILAEAGPRTVFDLGCGNGSVAKHRGRKFGQREPFSVGLQKLLQVNRALRSRQVQRLEQHEGIPPSRSQTLNDLRKSL